MKRNQNNHIIISALALGLILTLGGGCLSGGEKGIAASTPRKTTVAHDFYHRPLPRIPLPNDLATRYDATSPTKRRLNASLIAPTHYEERVRTLVDTLDGWGVFQPISIPFTGPLNIQSILDGHRDTNYDLSNDVIYLVNVDRDSEAFGEFHHLDVGNGNFPLILEQVDGYWKNDPRGKSLTLFFEETDEDTNGNGVLDPGEDTDADGTLDKPNYLPGAKPAWDDLGARADAIMTFYEAETHTLLVRPLIPLRERTTYAVVITTRLKDSEGEPVGSPFPGINHHSQTHALEGLSDALATQSVSLDDVAFAFTFSTQSIESDWKAVRDGLYGLGVQGHLGQEFPPEITGFEPMIDSELAKNNGQTPYIMTSDLWLPAFGLIAEGFLGADTGSEFGAKLIGGHQAVDFHVVGHFDSPQLFRRYDDEGRFLPFNQQSWPPDLSVTPVTPRKERVYFHMMVPRKEISARGEGKPVPVVIMGHGYTGNRFDAVTIGGYLARHGVAVIAIDCVSHGLILSDDEASQAEEITGLFGLDPMIRAVTQLNRALDLNHDGTLDSGGDFWTAYLFHTRDVVRQSALDYMQLTRILKSFDGKRRWKFDLNEDGEDDIAGDFDGDGKVDIGGSAHIGITGASLGGIMAAVVAGVDPNISVTVPIAGGGGLGDVGNRSIQGGVREAIHLRVMGPLFVGTQPTDSETMTLETIIPDVNSTKRVTLASISGVAAGDTLVVDNLRNGERGCGYIWDDNGTWRVRTSVESDRHDAIEIRFFRGNALVLGASDCRLTESPDLYRTIDTFEQNISFQDTALFAGDPLVALAEGLGLRRTNPELRRFMSIGQMVLDPSDPAVLAPFMMTRPITYGTGETTGAHALIVTTAGDMNVPANSGVSIGRSAGLIDFLTPDPRYDKSANQVLLDTYTVEAVEGMMRFTDPAGVGVIMDVENFSGGLDLWGSDIPRLTPPLRLGFDKKDALGGYSAAIFPFPRPSGQHGFAMPGGYLDDFRKKCASSCIAEDLCSEDKCTEDNTTGCGEDCVSLCQDRCAVLNYDGRFDIGNYLFNMMGRYLATNGAELPTDECMSSDSCDFPSKMP
jgi:dienelactone hydrolase